MSKIKQVIVIFEENGVKSYWGSNWNGFMAKFKMRLKECGGIV